MAIELPDDLIALERTGWNEIQEGRPTVPTALAVAVLADHRELVGADASCVSDEFGRRIGSALA
ncbi:hypothetical protein ACFRAO_07300 [Streptomyces sp. NPDC056656]|uniref:hypothetical protein n=1 Tax=Streptomyces sp. NPDC056656 TaxID=3345895 RepID=UPI0036A395C3